MKANILSRIPLPNLPSASGMEIIDDIVYIIGDDSPWLYRIRKSGVFLDPILLFKTRDFSSGRIPKKKKHDLEAMTIFPYKGDMFLLILGSGSRPKKRDVCFLVEPDCQVRKIKLSSLYESLRENPTITGGGKLNIEAAAATHTTLFLFQRGNISGINALLSFPLREFGDFLLADSEPPIPSVRPISLPMVHGYKPGLSGATILPGEKTILFTASLEDTKSETDDGAVYGSMMGVLPISAISDRKAVQHAMIHEHRKIYSGKVESVAVLERVKEGEWLVLAVTDDDKGGSELLHISITVDE